MDSQAHSSTGSLVVKKTKSRYPSMTSLVDVVFILLMFFMLTSSFNKLSLLNIQHSDVSDNSSNAAQQESIFLVLHAEDSVSIYPKSKPSPLSKIILQLQTSEKAIGKLILMPNSTVEVQLILSTMETLKLNGFNDLVLGELADE